VRDGVVDRVVAYLAPLLVGGPRGAVGGDGFAPIGEAARLVVRSVERLGDDVRVEADVHRDR
jgi:diaminohydroxyphosphoribosylaminopyrimidine deaminase/5-amino-6-(5-phosphoribosylamino)uracil reductase